MWNNVGQKKNINFKNRLYSILNRDTFVKSLLRGGRYRVFITPKEIEAFQIERFNIVWNDAINNIPFYLEWKKSHNLPNKISSLKDLTDWPILSKRDLQKNQQNLLRSNIKPTGYIKTGGSTGEPLHLPTWEDTETRPSMWLGRAAYKIEPGMKTFLIWGHHHLYGEGLLRQLNILKRSFKDWLSNMKRVSAYDLSENAMNTAFNNYKKYRPEFIIGFSSSILSFVRININRRDEQIHYPRVVLCTAGPLSLSESEEISSFFKASVCMEYGSVECGVMAYTEPNKKDYITFWDTHLLQGIKDKFGEVKNIVTRLTPCYVPLIRYDIGDYLELHDDNYLNSILRIRQIKGRSSDIIKLKNGTNFNVALIGDCVKQVDSVIASQLHVFADGLRIDLVALKILTNSDFSLIKLRLITVVPGLKNQNILIKQVEQLYNTVGGKTPLVIRHEYKLLD